MTPIIKAPKQYRLPLALFLLLVRTGRKTKKAAKNPIHHTTATSGAFVVRADGKDVLIASTDVLFVRSLGNYIEIHTVAKKIVTRERLYKFLELVPDPSAYIQVHRSAVIRRDKITGKNTQCVLVGSQELKVGNTFTEQISGFRLQA